MRLREPSNQYDFEAKRQYRETIWKAFAENVPDVKTAKVLFFPGRHGFEIPVALEHGFKEGNLIACEENPAIIATAKWRQEYPSIKCYGSELQRAIIRIRDDGLRLNAANLDFCSNLSSTIYEGLRAIVESECINEPLILAVTVLKGREQAELTSTVRATMGIDGVIDRLGVLRLHLTRLHKVSWGILKGEYRSNTKNMVYAIWSVRPESWLVGEYSNWFQVHSEEIGIIRDLWGKILVHTTPGFSYSIPKALSYHDESIALSHKLLAEYDAWRKPIQPWCARDHICDLAQGWELFVDAISHYINWEHIQDGIGERRESQLKECRQQLVKSESEKAQLLQAGRAWK